MEILAAGQVCGLDYFVLGGYFVLMAGIGVYFFRYMRGMSDYFSGGNRIPWWLSGVSFYMSTFSTYAFITYSAMAYKYGLAAMVLVTSKAMAVIVGVLFFAKKWRRARIDSPIEYIETRYSLTLRQLCAWQGIPVRMIDDSLKLIAIGVFVKGVLGFDLKLAIIISALIMTFYTMLGGLWAVAVTDFVQFIIMSVAVIPLIFLSLRAVGGVEGFIQKAPADFFKPICQEYDLFYLICMLTMLTFAYCSINWTLIQRYYCVPKERDSYKVGWFVVFLIVTGMPMILIPAMIARVHMPGIMDTNTAEVYPMLCSKLLPMGMLGLLVAAMFSSTLSMLSGDYNVCAGVLTKDVYNRLIRPKASPTELVWIGRGMTVVVGLIPLVIALSIITLSGDKLFRNMVTLFSIATAPVAIPMMLGVLTKQLTNKGALAGFFVGIASGIAVLLFGGDYCSQMHIKIESAILVVTTIVTLATTLAVSWLWPAGEEERKRVEAFLTKLKIPIGQLPEDTAGESQKGTMAISPFRVVGVSIILVSVLMFSVAPFVKDMLTFYMELGFAVALLAIGLLMVVLHHKDKNSKKENIV